MKRIILVLLFIIQSTVVFSQFTWTYYTPITTSSGVAVSIAASDAFIYNDNFYIFGSGTTLDAYSGQSTYGLFYAPTDTSSPFSYVSNKLPKAGKYQKVFLYGNKVYYFPERGTFFPFTTYSGIYKAVIWGNTIGSFSKIGDVPFYTTYSGYIQRTVIQNPNNNSYYILGGAFNLDFLNQPYASVVSNLGDIWVFSPSAPSFFEARQGGSVSEHPILYSISFDGLGKRTVTLSPISSNNWQYGHLTKFGSGFAMCTVLPSDSYIFLVDSSLTISSTKLSSTTLYDIASSSSHLFVCGIKSGQGYIAKVDSSLNTVVEYSDSASIEFRSLLVTNDYVYAAGSNGVDGVVSIFDHNLNLLKSKTFAPIDNNLNFRAITRTASALYVAGKNLASGSYTSMYIVKTDFSLNTITSTEYKEGTSCIPSLDIVIDNSSNRVTVPYVDSASNLGIFISDFSLNCITAKTYSSLYQANPDFGSTYYNGYIIVPTYHHLAMFDFNGTLQSVTPTTGDPPSTANLLDRVSYVKIDNNLIVDSWSTTLPFKVASALGTCYTDSLNNTYLYVFGGKYDYSSHLYDVWVAPVNSDNTLGTWSKILTWSGPPVADSDIVRIGNVVYIGAVAGPGTSSNMIEFVLGDGGTISSYTVFDPGVPSRQYLLATDNTNIYRIGGWKSNYEDPVADIYYAALNTPTITPTITGTPPSPTVTNTVTPTITPTNTSTITLTITPSITPTVTPTITLTPVQIIYRTSLTIYQGKVLVANSSGSVTVDLSSQWTWFESGFTVFVSRDHAQPNSYISVTKDYPNKRFTVTIRDRSTGAAVDTSTDPCYIYFTVLQTP